MRTELTDVSRRGFLRSAIGCVGAASLVPVSTSVLADGGVRADAHVGYRHLSADEGAFTEALVNALCPADALTPDGVTVGLSRAIDLLMPGQLDGVQGRGVLYKNGIAAANELCRQQHGVPLSGLADAAAFVRELARSEHASDFPLAVWYADVVTPLLTQACFTDPIYAVYDNRVFWKLFG